MIRNIYILLLLSLSFGQPNLQWFKTFGVSGGDDNGYSVQQTPDGGYIITGSKFLSTDNKDVWLIKTDSNGNEEWNKTFGGSAEDVGYEVQQTSDGGYIIGGHNQSIGTGGTNYYLIKTDSNGNEEWSKLFDKSGSQHEYARSVKQTTDGGYVIYGYAAFGIGGWLVKTDSNGNEEWNKTFSEGNGYHVQETNDNGYILVGSKSGDCWLVKTDSNGNEEWNRTYGGTSSDNCKSVHQTTDNGYILVGYTESFGGGEPDAWLIKTDSDGNEEWNKTFGEDEYDEASFGQQTMDSGFVITGMTQSFGVGNPSNVWVIKTDSNGNEEWNEIYGNIGIRSIGESISQTSDGGYIITGRGYADGENRFDLWLIKMGETTGCTNPEACNYDETATDDDGSCEYEEDCAGDCGGSAVLSGCDNECNSTLANDDCGVCDGGNASMDDCGICDGGNASNDCNADCSGSLSAGTWTNTNPGGAVDPSAPTTVFGSADDGSWELSACVWLNSPSTVDNGDGTVTITSEYGSDADHACALSSGVFNGEVTTENVSTHDVAAGYAIVGDVGFTLSSANSSNFSVTSTGTFDNVGADGSLNGSLSGGSSGGAVVDDCDDCVDLDDFNGTQDCAGVCDGTSVVDECGECGGGNSSCSGCTDPYAPNYDEEAAVDDGSCEEYGIPLSDGVDLIVYTDFINGDNSLSSVLDADWFVGGYPTGVIGQGVAAINTDGGWTGNLSHFQSDTYYWIFMSDTALYMYPFVELADCMGNSICLGDINGDGTINVIDIVIAVDLILSDNYDWAADVNQDGQLNVIDIVMIVNWILTP